MMVLTVFVFSMVFVLGAIIGSFLNVCIARLPLEKSLLWPKGSRCGACCRPVRARDNIPLISYWVLRGRCRDCGARFSIRYFFVELLTALGFVSLFYFIAVDNVHRLPALPPLPWAAVPDMTVWVYFAHHATLFSFLMIVAVCDLDQREIPLSVTLTGTLVGLAFAALFPWPWPHAGVAPRVLAPAGRTWIEQTILSQPSIGLYPWPFWWPLPEWFGLGGDWQTGLAVALVGALAGTILLRLVRFIFSTGLGVESLGLGDADLMMMAGAFLGWQPVVVAFFIAPVPALVFAVVLLVGWREIAIPFGPSLGLALMVVCLNWATIGPAIHILAWHAPFLLMLTGVGAVLMLVGSLVARAFRWLRGA